MISKFMKLFLLGWFSTVSAWASCAEIAGYWTSSGGARINICYPGNPDTFVVVVTYRGKRWEYTAHWMEGFRIQFYYETGTGTIYAVYDPETDQISISDQRGNPYTWYRK